MNYREPDDWARCIVDTRDAMADVHVRRKRLESVGTETPVPDLIYLAYQQIRRVNNVV